MSDHFPTLTTRRLILRPFDVDDCDSLLEITQEPDIFRYFPTKTPWDMDKVERAIRYQSDHWNRHHYGLFAITARKDGQLMGWCGLEYLPDTNETEVGYLLGHAFWGKGYASEAAKASVKFGLREMGMKQIIGLTDPANFASQRVLEKCGLKFTRRQVYFGTEMLRFAIQA